METTRIPDLPHVDLPSLDVALRAELGDAFGGVSHQRATVIVHHAPHADPLLIRSVVLRHAQDAPDRLLERARERQQRRAADDAARALLADDAAWASASSAAKFDALRRVLLRR